MISLGEKLKQARINKNISQEYIAEALDISQKTYSNFENNRTTPNFSQIEAIARILEVSILDFTSIPDKFSFNNNNTITGGYNGYVINNIPEKLLEQYELRIKKLEEENLYLKELLNKMVK